MSMQNNTRMTYEMPNLPKPDTDHIYVDMTFFNDNTSNINVSNQSQPARIIQQFNRDLISNPEEWNMTIARFSINSDTVPRVTQVLGTTGGSTDLYVGLQYNGVTFTEPIVLPTYPNLSGPVQAVYQVNEFLDLINAGYQAAQLEVGLAGGPTGATGVAAFMMYAPDTGLYTMNIPSFYMSGTGSSLVEATMSYQLYHKFQGFDVTQSDPILMNTIDDVFINKVRGDNVVTLTYPNVGVTGLYIQLRQDAPWGASIQDVDRLLITSQQLPVVPEYRAQQLYTQYFGNKGDSIIKIVTDFFIGQDSQIIARGENFIYTPQLYRICSLKGNTPIQNIDLSIYVATRDGTIFQLYINPLDYIDVKILFIRKGLVA